MEVKLGNEPMIFPSKTLQQLQPNNEHLNDRAKLWQLLEDQGYLYLKNFHNREEVLDARLAVLEHIDTCGKGKLHPDFPIHNGILNERCGLGCVPMLEGKKDITHSTRVARILEGRKVFAFFKMLFGEEVLTFDYKWLRAMHSQGFTGAHVDNVYMSRGTKRVITLWTPLGDITADMGTLAVCESSNSLTSFQPLQCTYGNIDVEEINLQGTGWFTENPSEITQRFGGVWKTSNFEAGDVLMFTLRTVHMSTANLTNKARISCDTRWQPATAPVDQRYMGRDAEAEKPKFGVHATDKTRSTENVTMEILRKSWGFM